VRCGFIPILILRAKRQRKYFHPCRYPNRAIYKVFKYVLVLLPFLWSFIY